MRKLALLFAVLSLILGIINLWLYFAISGNPLNLGVGVFATTVGVILIPFNLWAY